MTIIEAIQDENLFRPFLSKDAEGLVSWQRWMAALRLLYGLPISKPRSRALVEQCTGRDPARRPKEGFSTALFLCGRRSGKSRISAVIAAYEACFAGHEKRLAAGEKGIVCVISPTREQSGVVWSYLRGVFESSPLLRQEVAHTKESAATLVLRNGLEVRVVVGDFRTARGYSICCAIIDEAAFFGLSEESHVRSDTELIRAVQPALLTTRGKLIAISTPYARKGWVYQQWQRYHGANRGTSPSFSPKWSNLVWVAPSMAMNPTLPQSAVDAALAEDPAAARAEYLAEWRDDVSLFLPRSVIEALVVKGRKELSPRNGIEYVAFADVSGGRTDASALCIAHLEGRTAVLDLARAWKAPHNPHQVIGEQAELLKKFGLRHVTGDNYSAAFVADSFGACGISYAKSDLPKSKLYAELLPRLCSGEIELLDNEMLVDQLAGLERKTRAGGADIIDHGPNGHDDLANAVAGAAVSVAKRRVIVGAIRL